MSSTNFKNTSPDNSTSAFLAARLKTSLIISLFYRLLVLNLRWEGLSSLTPKCGRQKCFY